LAQFAPELQSVAVSLNVGGCTKSRLWELIVAVVTLCLEEWVNTLALLAGFALLA